MKEYTFGYKGETYKGGERKVSCTTLLPVITHRIQSSQDLVDLILIKQIYDQNNKPLEVVIPYFPYARQDRVTDKNESFSLKAICNIVNSLGFKKVHIHDPHSDVTSALLNNVRVIPQEEIIYRAFPEIINRDVVIIAPDAGAAKKAQKISEQLNKPIAYAIKHRDTNTGELTFIALAGDVEGKECLIVDDICDGGGTFIALGNELKARGASAVSLYVTHGIFSNGISVFKNIIEHIYTTNTFISEAIKEAAFQKHKITVKEIC